MRQEPLECRRANEALDRGPRTRDDDLRPRPLYELSVFHTGGAGGLAGAAVEALGDVILEAGRVRAEPVLPHGLHEPDAPARRVHLDAEYRVRGAGR